MAAPTYNPVLSRQSQEDCKLEASLQDPKNKQTNKPERSKRVREPMETSFINRKMEENEFLLTT